MDGISFFFGGLLIMLFFLPIGILEFYIYYLIEDKRKKVTMLQVFLFLLWGILSIYFIYAYAVSLDIINAFNILLTSILVIVVLFITCKVMRTSEMKK